MKKKIAVLTGIGVAGGFLLYALESQRRRNRANVQNDNESAASMARIEDGEPAIRNEDEHVIDDRGTDQAQAFQILKHIRDRAFEASDEKLALALGRPTEEIEEWIGGHGLIDGDVVMKARTLAMQRGFEI